MIKEAGCNEVRLLKRVALKADFVVAGGGIAGICAAVTAARQGIKTVLVQDRPVLGGNASSEVRLWILGATSHMGNNNRWAREGGIVDEILIENLYRNKEGNPLILDTILLEMVMKESNITLLLNTAIYDLYKSSSRTIEFILAFCSQNSTQYQIEASMFCDATGDGIVAFKAGAAFRMGAESRHEFGELFAPDKGYGELLGHSIYFYSKRADGPVKYIAPSFAIKDIKEIPRYKIISKNDNGCRFWWLEYGGRLDTIHDTEQIKWELWKIVYGVWDYIKNSGSFDDVDNLTLEWVGTIPGKRESRRFEGLYMLNQNDIVAQQYFEDAISFGGWAMDLHPADGVYSSLPSCTQWHTKGVYQIPYRCYVSKDIDNLFFAGRIISVSHVAFGSTRVMATCGAGGQAVGMAAAICIHKSLKPAEVLSLPNMTILQNKLNRIGQAIPGIALPASENLLSTAKVSATSVLELDSFNEDGTWYNLTDSVAQLTPLRKQTSYRFSLKVHSEEDTTITIQFRQSLKPGNFTPEVIIETISLPLKTGEQIVEFELNRAFNFDQYVFITFLKNRLVKLAQSTDRISGLLSVFNSTNKAVSNNGLQLPPDNIGVDSFEFWIPKRRPDGKNLAMKFSPAIDFFSVDNIFNGFTRPTTVPNVWVADLSDKRPTIVLQWPVPVTVKGILLFFDNDFDHPLESVLMGHPESVIPFCISGWEVKNENMVVLASCDFNHHSIGRINFKDCITIAELHIELKKSNEYIPASLFEIIVL